MKLDKLADQLNEFIPLTPKEEVLFKKVTKSISPAEVISDAKHELAAWTTDEIMSFIIDLVEHFLHRRGDVKAVSEIKDAFIKADPKYARAWEHLKTYGELWRHPHLKEEYVKFIDGTANEKG